MKSRRAADSLRTQMTSPSIWRKRGISVTMLSMKTLCAAGSVVASGMRQRPVWGSRNSRWWKMRQRGEMEEVEGRMYL